MQSCQHQHNKIKNNVALIAAAFIILFGAVEAFFGYWSGSLTLLSDAGHMATDSLSLMLAAFAIWIKKRPTTSKHTYGFGRVEILAAWISSVVLLIMIIGISVEAIKRFNTPTDVASMPVMIVAVIGLIVNIITAKILHKGEKTINIRAAYLHVLSDLLGSVVVLISGLIIYFTGWNKIDPILSLFICFLILIATINLLRESVMVLMESTPSHIDYDKVKKTMESIESVKTIHDLHVWTLTSGVTLLTAHAVVEDKSSWPTIIDDLRIAIKEEFDISHSTIQLESSNQNFNCVDCNSE